MNEIGKRAREAAIDHGMWLAPDDDETNYQAFVAGYLRGYSDRGVEATAARDEYEKELATLRARVAELEARVPETCQECRGQGMIESVGMEHGSGCTDSRCCSDCPVPVQVLEPCGACGGYGALMVPPIPLPGAEE